jgi:hypothetical protein
MERDVQTGDGQAGWLCENQATALQSSERRLRVRLIGRQGRSDLYFVLYGMGYGEFSVATSDSISRLGRVKTGFEAVWEFLSLASKISREGGNAVLAVNWRKCGADEHWCDFFSLDLTSRRFGRDEGVYIIWHGGESPAVIYVGQGEIRSALAAHREDPKITQYQSHGPMYVTWDTLDTRYIDGVERYLARVLLPLVPGPERDADIVEVPLPQRWMRVAAKSRR